VVLLVASSLDQPSELLQRVHFMIDDLDAGLVGLFHDEAGNACQRPQLDGASPVDRFTSLCIERSASRKYLLPTIPLQPANTRLHVWSAICKKPPL
jgi:hypothetical protein